MSSAAAVAAPSAPHLLPARVRSYLNTALAGAPTLAARLLEGVTTEELDRRPDPERFTIREALAHVADWEAVWLERIRRIAEQNEPFLPGYDEAQWAIDHDYAHSDAAAQLARYISGRRELCAYVRGLPEEAYGRRAQHGEIGALTLGDLLTLVLAHDNYHLLQFDEFRTR